MTRETRERADRILQDRFHRCSIEWYNKRLDNLEEEIINVMKIKGWDAWELVHGLIGERENTKYRLKELHKTLYG
jgi:hypothetical protein